MKRANKMLHLIIIIMTVAAMPVMAQHHLTLMSFNCENAFDTIHDSGKNDYEYISSSPRRWNKRKLFRKLDGIAKVIAAGDTVQPVGLVGLCEVENDTVLEYLTKKSILKTLGYDYLMTQSQDLRGIDVALLYSKYVFLPTRYESIRSEKIGTPTRDILHVTGIVSVDDTIDVYVVHLPSKLGGADAKRKGVHIAEVLKENVDSVLSLNGNNRVIIMGDFNDDYNSTIIRDVLGAEKYWKVELRTNRILYDVIEKQGKEKIGTYKYKGNWNIIDHILVSGRVDVQDAGILSLPSLLEEDEKFGGTKPRRTYIGYKYNGGISDHLPIWMRMGL